MDESADEVARQFSDHDWISAPVVDDNNILLGRITIDDVVDIIREQAEHQALGAAGLDEDEDLFSPVPRALRRRMLWLGDQSAARRSSPRAWSASSKARSRRSSRSRC